MAKIYVRPVKKGSGPTIEQIKTKLGEENACYVLITCSPPSSAGEMEVELSYQGDDTLASYLLENAQEFFESRHEIPGTMKEEML